LRDSIEAKMRLEKVQEQVPLQRRRVRGTAAPDTSTDEIAYRIHVQQPQQVEVRVEKVQRRMHVDGESVRGFLPYCLSYPKTNIGPHCI